LALLLGPEHTDRVGGGDAAFGQGTYVTFPSISNT
jgi:hypothetical protein